MFVQNYSWICFFFSHWFPWVFVFVPVTIPLIGIIVLGWLLIIKCLTPEDGNDKIKEILLIAVAVINTLLADVSLLLSFAMICPFYHGVNYLDAMWYGLSGQYCHSSFVFNYKDFTWKEWVIVTSWFM
ncbi:hypothetical protein RFI_18752 [Reticulomyxa filosa]|uniref:Uncharacterized protein n=1 Tax=Reticulomyxa filosa TaxID=46433 RepID=X6MXH2_RETFI|nr:hypothetical protein RFI_18752 [Reticulomyxa filosa]|eukprot:ETO18514.1 hypothetical protein RFI_18752 [Reticulomyxa filosa]